MFTSVIIFDEESRFYIRNKLEISVNFANQSFSSFNHYSKNGQIARIEKIGFCMPDVNNNCFDRKWIVIHSKMRLPQFHTHNFHHLCAKFLMRQPLKSADNNDQ